MKYIKRALLLVLILCLACGCAPTNVGNQPPADPDEPQKPSAQTPQAPVDAADNLWLDQNAKRNDGLLPRGVNQNHTWIKTAKNNTLTFYYPAEKDAFSYTDGKTQIGETSWFRAIKEKYDITVHAVRKAPASSLSAQRLAQLSGLPLDLMAFTPAQLPYALGMTADATTLLDGQRDALDFLNTTLLTYGDAGKRFITPVGVARNLWYTTDAAISPLALSESKLWDYSAFSVFVSSRTKTENGQVTVYGYEAQDFNDFLYALGTPVITYQKAFEDGTAAAKDNIIRLQQLNAVSGQYYNGKSTDKNAPALIRKTLAMRYGQTPFLGTAESYPEFEWAPLPVADRHQGEGTVSACAPVLALPRDGAKNEVALSVALLWAARFADANHDLLRFTYGMKYAVWEKYYSATNRLMHITYGGDEAVTTALLQLSTAAAWSDDQYGALSGIVTAQVKQRNERLPR